MVLQIYFDSKFHSFLYLLKVKYLLFDQYFYLNVQKRKRKRKKILEFDCCEEEMASLILISSTKSSISSKTKKVSFLLKCNRIFVSPLSPNFNLIAKINSVSVFAAVLKMYKSSLYSISYIDPFLFYSVYNYFVLFIEIIIKIKIILLCS